MQRTRRVLNVFLASPSDVLEERSMADDIVAKVNKLVRRFDWQVDLRKWEDMPPAFGRPQAKINPMVDECDLFIGLLWQRFGQPSGEYSSGFEEEYERVRARRKRDGEPEIWLVFRAVEDDRLKDPGDQLKKVIAFRRSQEDLHEVLFRDVRDAEDWKAQLHTWLLDYVFDLALPSQTLELQPAFAVPAFDSPDATTIESASGETDERAIPQQLKTLSATLNKALQGTSLEFSSTDTSPLQELDVARLFLLSMTLMSHRYTNDVLGTHEINLLYKHREQLDLTSTEQYQLLRSLVTNKGEVRPGWFWFRDMQEEQIKNALFVLAVRDSSDEARIQALGLLGDAKIVIPEDVWAVLPLSHDSWLVRESAVSYLAAVGSETALPFLEKLRKENDPLLNSAIDDGKLQISARIDPARVLSEILINGEHRSDDQIKLLQNHISDIHEDTLSKGVDNPSELMRQLSLKELMRRGSLSVAVALKCAKEDPFLLVRALAFESLAKQAALPDFDVVRKALTNEESRSGSGLWRLSGLLGGRSENLAPDIDSIIVTFYRTQTTEQLVELVDWFSGDGYLAYRALALDRFDVIAPSLRSDMEHGFKRIREESIARLRAEFGEEKGNALAEKWHELDAFIQSQFTQSALLGLAENARPGDAELARPYLEHASRSLSEPAVAVISKVGSSGDVNILLKIAKEAYGDVKEQAASAALRLSPKPVEVARELIESKSSEVMKIAFNWMFAQSTEEVRKMFEELLASQSDTNRVRALYYLSSRMPIKALEQFLKEYLAREPYFYNVVTWLDRLLYSPMPLRGMFVNDLEQQAKR